MGGRSSGWHCLPMENAIVALLAASLMTSHTAELPVASPDQPWVLLIPGGTFSGRDGRGPYHAGDVVSLEKIAANTRAYHGATEILIDYEHQSINSQKNGQPAPAAGWIKEVQARPDGLYGRVEWTDKAAHSIKSREYRYLSPVYFYSKAGQVLALQHAGLTNIPNLHMAEVAAHSFFSAKTSNEVSMKHILAALGLAEGASETDALTAINSLLTSSTAIAAAAGLMQDAKSEAIATAVQTAFADRKKIAIAAGQAENASVDQIVGALAAAHKAAAPDPNKFVPVDLVAAMQADLNALKDRTQNADAEAVVGDAIKAGKLIPALKDWAIAAHKSDPTHLATFLGAAPVLTAAQRSSAVPLAGGSAVAGLDDADIAVMRQMGLTPEDMKKSKEAMEASY